jgi:hypothetical protein
MFTLKLEYAGGFPGESAPMTGAELVAMFNEGMIGVRPVAVNVGGEWVSFKTFKAIFHLDREDRDD